MLRAISLRVVGMAAALAVSLGQPLAQTATDFPNRPITLIVPFQAGVSADLLFRGFAEIAAKELGQPVIVENRAGASGTLGAVALATQAKPDGYTIAQLPVPVYRVPLMQKVPYDPAKDFTFVILVAGYTLGGVVKADGPYKTLKDVVEYARTNPGKFTYTTIGPSTTNAIAMELVGRHENVQFTHVPSKGGGESIAAVLGNHIMMMVESPGWAPLVASGELRLLMLLGDQRSKKWPDVPTLKDLGYPIAFDSPTGLAGPKGMAPAVVKKLHDAFKKAYDDPKVADLYEKYDFVRRYMGHEEYAKYGVELVELEREAMRKVGLVK